MKIFRQRNLEMEFMDLNPPERILLGPGPSNVSARVMKALSSPIVGYMDPYFFDIMNQTQILLRNTFKTKNALTLPLSGTGSAGMEAAFSNTIEAGDEVVVGVNGYFGERMCEVITHLGGTPVRVVEEWGRIISEDAIEGALKNSKAKIIAIVHGETSTGIEQPIKEIAALTKKYDAILIVDAVTSLSGCELDVDGWGIDVCYSGSQKCINCPPGLAPITVNERALNTILNRKTKVPNFYLDLSLISKYWSETRVYHHTPPASMIYAIREALRVVQEEGLENRWERHRRNSQAFIAGIEAMGLKMHAQMDHRLPSLNTVVIPDGVSDASLRRRLLNDFDIEIGGGLGALRGKIWRIGLMGINSTEKNVIMMLETLERTLNKEGFHTNFGEGVKAATEFYNSH
ncbi:MAG: alanine-glyoxylate transaminase / serine-glyoxylate transaminase / serine-pyruvate transaminase [Thermoproteota archaeon]|nr:alanine-glyoxylate transaminase / serine-glyoxylate transaminase / serine-pyruvate transaminase [Thermoproteota archaeon]